MAANLKLSFHSSEFLASGLTHNEQPALLTSFYSSNKTKYTMDPGIHFLMKALNKILY